MAVALSFFVLQIVLQARSAHADPVESSNGPEDDDTAEGLGMAKTIAAALAAAAGYGANARDDFATGAGAAAAPHMVPPGEVEVVSDYAAVPAAVPEKKVVQDDPVPPPVETIEVEDLAAAGERTAAPGEAADDNDAERAPSFDSPALEGLSQASRVASGAVEPKVYFTYPAEGAVLSASKAAISIDIDPPNFDLTARGMVMCIEILFRHGRQRNCFDGTPELSLDGLESGQILAIATLEVNSTGDDDDGDGDGNVADSSSVLLQGGHVVSRASRTVYIELDTEPSRIGITFPRTDEHLSVQYVGVALRLDNFGAEDGYICMTISKGISLDKTGTNVEAVESKEDQCILATRKEVVVSTDFPAGLNGVSAQLYYPDGQPVAERQGTTNTWFRITPPTMLERPAMGTVQDWSSCGGVLSGDQAKGDRANGVLVGEMATLPTVHIAVLSAISYNRYNEALVMIKSILFNRKRANMLHFHMIVDPAGRIFFTEMLLALRLPGLRVTFHDFERVCVRPNERFLKKYNFTQSAHYSGHAGYCRLYMYRHLKNTVPGITGVIAVESDQIFLDDVVELWEEFSKFPEAAMVGMPELYKPWGKGRNQPSEFDITDGKTEGLMKRGSVEEVYHGNGFIGGIIMLNFTRMGRGSGWHDLVDRSMQQYLDIVNAKAPAMPDSDGKIKDDEAWNPQMNDQDIFNSVFKMHPELIYNLPCQWNIQFHAFQEQLRMCGDDTRNLECSEAKSEGMFLCRRKPSVVHFMAQSYKSSSNSVGKQYYSEFWNAMDSLNVDLLRYDFLERSCATPQQ